MLLPQKKFDNLYMNDGKIQCFKNTPRTLDMSAASLDHFDKNDPVLTIMFMLASLSSVLKRPLWTGHTSCSPAKGDTVMVRPTGRIGRLSLNPPSIHVWYNRTRKRVKTGHRMSTSQDSG